jgi:Bacteriophage baseplate protein W
MSPGAADPTTVAFPFSTTRSGGIGLASGEDRIRAKVLQVLFTTPGERVNQPDFGCGVFDLVFEPNDPVLAAAMEFTIGQALMRWLGGEIAVERVDVESVADTVAVEVAWTNRADGSRVAIRVRFR